MSQDWNPMVKRNHEKESFIFHKSWPESVKDSEAAFIAVGTPPGEDGSADLKYVLTVAREIGQNIDDYTVVVTKSTVPVGTAEKVKSAVSEELEKEE